MTIRTVSLSLPLEPDRGTLLAECRKLDRKLRVRVTLDDDGVRELHAEGRHVERSRRLRPDETVTEGTGALLTECLRWLRTFKRVQP